MLDDALPALAAPPNWTTAIVTGSATLVSALVAATVVLVLERWRRRSAHEQWLLDRRLELYHQVFDVVTEFDHAVDAYLQARRGTHAGVLGSTESVSDAAADVRRGSLRLMALRTRMPLVASDAATAAVGQIVLAADRVHSAVRAGTEDKVADLDGQVYLTTASFTELVRLELAASAPPRR
ncbi:hypothetical protein DQ237_09690 [Blastococcus sp. TF02-8]|uniref:hypothetical protein n=1 Tax=Blastococcus sp. TF02-8 TaxID=2250574 RepID=UPI000DEBB8D4|nr:hypothetical protein [Blastococcus sp. TF02-8]RBY96142.1 hypothetical protein DQ237_09690 [Blastococcus sp. TF02-8]